MECFDNYNLNSGDMYFVSSDIISFVSQTGDIHFGTSTDRNSNYSIPKSKFTC